MRSPQFFDKGIQAEISQEVGGWPAGGRVPVADLIVIRQQGNDVRGITGCGTFIVGFQQRFGQGIVAAGKAKTMVEDALQVGDARARPGYPPVAIASR